MIQRRTWKLRSLLAAALAVSLAGQALAGSFTVTPVRIFMTPRDRAVALTIVNEADDKLVLQTEVFRWGQDATRETMTETEDVVVVPPILTIPPKGRQVVRLATVRPNTSASEVTYRLLVREVVEAAKPKSDDEVQVPIALTLSLPIFITPPRAKRDVVCDVLSELRDGNPSLRCENKGTAYAQIRRVEVTRGEAQLAELDVGVSILPGISRTVVVPRKPDARLAGDAAVVVTFDDGKQQNYEVKLP